MNRKVLFENSPVIAAIKDERELENVLTSDCSFVFVLFGNICTICQIVSRLKKAEKTVIVHADLIDGFSSDEIVADYIKKTVKADGLISTKTKLVARAKGIGLIAGWRTFIIDSKALEITKKQLSALRPDFIEILPAVAYGSISEIHQLDDIPIVAGGLIKNRQNIYDALNAGAVAVSTSNSILWE